LKDPVQLYPGPLVPNQFLHTCVQKLQQFPAELSAVSLLSPNNWDFELARNMYA